MIHDLTPFSQRHGVVDHFIDNKRLCVHSTKFSTNLTVQSVLIFKLKQACLSF